MRPEELYTFPRTRNSAVTCLAFGKDRKENFPDYFFCHGCDLLEDAVWSGNTRANRNQAKYVCTGGHEGNRIHPTKQRQEYRPRCKNKNPWVKVDEEDEDHTSSDAPDDTEQQQSSPTKSPVKKKFRQSGRRLSSMAQSRYAERCSSSSGEESGTMKQDDNDDHDNAENLQQQFATALAFPDEPVSEINQQQDAEEDHYSSDDDGFIPNDVMLEYINDLEREKF